MNKGYIDKEFFESITGIILEDAGFDNNFQDSVFTASETINAFCGNTIEDIGIENLSERQQVAVKKTTAFLVKYYLKTGEADAQIGSGSMAMGGVNFAYSSPTGTKERRYIPETVINILDQAGLLNQTIGIDPMKQKKEKDEDKGYKYRR